MLCKRMIWFVGGALALTFMVGPVQGELEFGIPKPLPSYINGGLAGIPYLTPDDLSMYFTANLPGSVEGSLDIWVTSRSSPSDPWDTPVNLGTTVNTSTEEMGMSLTADGLELYFERTSNLLTHEDGELWVSRRSSLNDSWGIPEPIVELNTSVREGFPFISPDGFELYFDSTREPDFPIPGNLVNTYVARRTSRSEPFGTPEFFYISGAGKITDDGLSYLMFANDVVGRFDGDTTWYGEEDLYIRTRDSATGAFSPGVNLRAPINTPALDCCGDFTSDKSTIYFTSTRPGGPGIINMWEAPLAQAVVLDINPNGGDTPIDWRTQSTLTAAILSSDMFDALKLAMTEILVRGPLVDCLWIDSSHANQHRCQRCQWRWLVGPDAGIQHC